MTFSGYFDGSLKAGLLPRDEAANTVRVEAGLPLPPSWFELSDENWWQPYQRVERALLRYSRAMSTLPAGSARRAQLAALWPSALDQLATVRALCDDGSRIHVPAKRNLRRRRQRRKLRAARDQVLVELRAIVLAMERFGDSAAAVAFNYAIDAGDDELDITGMEDALSSVAATLDELSVLNREALDP